MRDHSFLTNMAQKINKIILIAIASVCLFLASDILLPQSANAYPFGRKKLPLQHLVKQLVVLSVPTAI